MSAGGRLVDRAQPVHARFDGQPLQGYAGDTLASALLASGRRVVGRSFKYHRPRGLLAAGPEEPNALVTLRDGGRREPNIPATTVELFEGLVAESQNRWPSLDHDLLALFGLGGPLLQAGFYYKTFMGPTAKAWRLYEPWIRRAAGLGRAGRDPDPDRYDKASLWCDVLVIGAGPAGLAAAAEAAGSGRRVVLAEQTPRLGGSGLLDDSDAVVAAEAALAASPDVTILRRTTVWGAYDGMVLAAVERLADHLPAPPPDLPRQRLWRIHAREVVLATGAVERPMVFPGNDLPGVMLADAVLRYALLWGVAAGRRIAVLTNHDRGHEVARRLAGLGLQVTAVIDPRPTAATAAETAALGITVYHGHLVAAVEGRHMVRGLRLAGVDGSAGPVLDADTLAVAGGWTPLVQLASQAGAQPIWDERRQTFLPGPLPTGWRAVGACAGDGLPEVAPLPDVTRRHRGKAFVDLQNDVTAEDVRLAVREGFGSVEHLKRYTTLGMATDQGRTSSVNGLALLAAARDVPIAELGTTRFRPPFAPVALGALAGRSRGAHLRPERRTPMHDWHLAHGAEMYETGLWLRPRAYLRPGETVATAYVREAKAVREAVGIVDVSTLGKIDVQGPDSATFLDRLYCNAMASLPVGKARYGLMLREDGMVFDDGTAWRLGPDRFLVTTTTANAATVLGHLEHLLAVVWPELRVVVTSVTDQWAGMAVAGPHSREVLAAALDGVEMSHAAFPPMGVREARCGAIPVLVARLSFSGERAYEVYAPWTEGEAVWRRLLAAGEPFGIVAYGLEAMGALRIEKGHVAGPELDGRTTPADLGLGRMVSRRKSFVGSAMLDRPGLTQASRLQLVGLIAVDRQPVRAGAHLVESADRAKPGRSLGHVTSWTWSPALGRYAALGLLEGGLRHAGRRLWATYPLRREHVPVEVVHPCLYDREGARLDG